MIIFTCPKCGHDLINYMLTSDPPLEKKECLNCGWSKYIYQRENIRIPFYEMREVTLEEQKSIQKHIDQISKPTGVSFYDSCDDFSVSSACVNCSNNPKNGGTGICFCTLGQQTFY